MGNIRANYGYTRSEGNGRISLEVFRLGSIKLRLGLFYWFLFLVPSCVAFLSLKAISQIDTWAHPDWYPMAALTLIVASLFALLGAYFLYRLYAWSIVIIEGDSLSIGNKRFSKADIHSLGFQAEAVSLKNVPEKLLDWLTSLEIHHVYFYYGCEKRYCATTLTKPQALDVCAILNKELPQKKAGAPDIS